MTAMTYRHAPVRDSYTGFLWCARALHLLTPENCRADGACLTCATNATRKRRAKLREHAARTT